MPAQMCTAMMSVAMFGLPSPRSLEFSSMPAPECETNPAGKYDGPVDYTISAFEESCIKTEKNCYNRYHPAIPLARPETLVLLLLGADILILP